VECSGCHDEAAEQHASGPHGKWAPDPLSPSAACMSCHGRHDIASPTDPSSPTHPKRSVELCGRCHSKPLAEVARSSHGAVGDEPPGAGCADCHAAHAASSPSASSEQDETCGTCHAEQSRGHVRSLHGRAATRGDPLAPSCLTCHSHHAIESHTEPASPTSTMNIPLLCGRCHHEGTEVSLTHDIPPATHPTTSSSTTTPSRASTGTTWRGPAPPATPASRRSTSR
jgi:hypothetical protein